MIKNRMGQRKMEKNEGKVPEREEEERTGERHPRGRTRKNTRATEGAQ
jgi:hypothetical protein